MNLNDQYYRYISFVSLTIDKQRKHRQQEEHIVQKGYSFACGYYRNGCRYILLGCFFIDFPPPFSFRMMPREYVRVWRMCSTASLIDGHNSCMDVAHSVQFCGNGLSYPFACYIYVETTQIICICYLFSCWQENIKQVPVDLLYFSLYLTCTACVIIYVWMRINRLVRV